MNQNNDFWNSLALASFIFGLLNYEENIDQSDLQEVIQNSNRVQKEIIDRIEQHLILQDEKIETILQILRDKDT